MSSRKHPVKISSKYSVSQRSTLASHDIFIQDDGAARLKLFFRPLHQLLSRVMLSTMETGKIVRSLAGVPDKSPILFVALSCLWVRASSLAYLGGRTGHRNYVRTPKIGPVAYPGTSFLPDLGQLWSGLSRPNRGSGYALGTPDAADSEKK